MSNHILICIGIFVFPLLANPVLPVVDGKWQIFEVDGKAFENSKVFIQFDESANQILGNAGCNRFSGTYSLEDGKFSVKGVASTKMACFDDGVMEKEALIFKALSDAKVLENKGEIITASTEGKVRLKLRRGIDQTDLQTELSARKWKLNRIGDKEVNLAEDLPFLKFDGEKKSSGGNSGCNVFGGTFEVSGNLIKFSDIISTMRACEFEDRMTIERGLFDGLQKANRFRLDGSRLILLNGDSAILEFEAMKDE